jgi:predicted ribosome quality control (RQC) complex YloA/Tae2 family protein
VHNSSFFLQRLAVRLEQQLRGYTLVSCFSQDKDELVLEFNDARNSLFLKASLQPEIQCLSFPHTFRRARKNSIDIFPEIILRAVKGVRAFRNERSIAVALDGNSHLVFKMHGKQSNIILFNGNQAASVFRHNFPADTTLSLDSLDRDIDWSREAFLADPATARKRYITFGRPVWNYLDESGWATKSPEDQWKMVSETKDLLEKGNIFLAEARGAFVLTLMPQEDAVMEFADPLLAVTEFYHRYQSRAGFDRERKAVLSTLRGRITQTKIYLDKIRQRQAELEGDAHYTRWADLIMANLHRLTAGMAEARLEDFHQPEQLVVVKLKEAISPQKNAEVYYRKAKNQQIEKKKLTESLTQKEGELARLNAQEQAAMSAEDSDQLRPIAQGLEEKARSQSSREALPYRAYEFRGYRIWVGKHAEANDELTLKHTFKEDLWLHAKDVAGSHVVIKHQAGKTFPQEVINYAASLAAYYSKRRNETLCPVAVTPVKYVRKRKGDPPGMVVVQREKVVMIEPASGAKV